MILFLGFYTGQKIRIFGFLGFGIFIDIFLFQVRVFVLEFFFRHADYPHKSAIFEHFQPLRPTHEASHALY